MLFQGDVFQPVPLAFRHGDDAFRALAICHLLIHLRRDDGGVQVARVVQAVEHKQFLHLVAAGDAVLNLALTLHYEESFLAAQCRLLLQGHDVLYAGVLYAGNDILFHNLCAKIIIIIEKFVFSAIFILLQSVNDTFS